MIHWHHWHRFKTTLKYVALDCPGERVRWYRCCKCRKVYGGLYVLAAEGEPEKSDWYEITREEVHT